MSRNRSRRIKVLFFTSMLGGGGAERQMLRIANHLDPKKFEASIAVSRLGGAYEELVVNGVSVHGLAPRWITSSTLGLAASVLPLRSLVAKSQPDILCSFMDHANVAASASLRSLKGNTKLVLCAQNAILERRAGASSWLERGLRRIMPALYADADRIIALSEGVGADLRDVLLASPGLVEIVHNAGVDDDLYLKAQEPVDHPWVGGAPPIMIACGRLVEQKGYPVLLEALRGVVGQVETRLWILGEGPLRARLEAMARDLGIKENVEFLGFQKNPFKFMAAAEIFVLSSHFEGFGNVLAEAMAAGCAVVATNCPHGPSEIIDNAHNGLLVRPNDSEALASALVALIRDEGRRKSMQSRAKERANDFHARNSAGGYAAVFEELLASSS